MSGAAKNRMFTDRFIARKHELMGRKVDVAKQRRHVCSCNVTYGSESPCFGYKDFVSIETIVRDRQARGRGE